MKLAIPLPAILSAAVLLLRPTPASAQEAPLDPVRQRVVLERLIGLVSDRYVVPEKAVAVAAALRGRESAGAYAPLRKPDDFLAAVNRDMQDAAGDRHLRLMRNPRIVARLRAEAGGEKEVPPEFLAMLRRENFRLRKAESLDGNVGYLKLDAFVELRFVRDALLGALDFLHASSALVLDLTDNGGGDSETADLLLSCFLPEGTRTTESWSRETGKTTVSAVVRPPGVKPMLDTPLTVVVGERTASAAEAVAYTLQQARRAVVVGSRTKGMANPGRLFVVDDSLYAMVPTIRARNVVSGTSWEGVGVAPDVPLPPEKALAGAVAEALKGLAAREADPKERFRLLFLWRDYAAAVNPPSPPDGLLDACVGAYEGGQRVVRRDGSLWFEKGEVRRRLSYVGDLTFAVEGRKDYRIRFPFEGGRVLRCDVLWFDDTSDSYARARAEG